MLMLTIEIFKGNIRGHHTLWNLPLKNLGATKGCTQYYFLFILWNKAQTHATLISSILKIQSWSSAKACPWRHSRSQSSPVQCHIYFEMKKSNMGQKTQDRTVAVHYGPKRLSHSCHSRSSRLDTWYCVWNNISKACINQNSRSTLGVERKASYSCFVYLSETADWKCLQMWTFATNCNDDDRWIRLI